MKLPIKKLDRWITFPLVIFIYGFVGYLSFAYPGKIVSIQLPFGLLSIFSVCMLFLISFKKRIFFSPDLSKAAASPRSLHPPAVSGFSFLTWLLVFYLGLFGFVIINVLIQGVLTHFNPYVAKLYISSEWYNEAIYPILRADNYIYWGYFSALAVLGVGLSYVYYTKQSVPCLHRVAAPLFSQWLTYKKFSIWAKAFGESHVYLVNLTWFGLVMLCSTILLSTALLSFAKLPSYFTIPIISMSFFSVFFLLFASSFLGKNIKKLNKKSMSLSLVTVIFGIMMVGLLLLAGKAIQLILTHQPDILKMVECDCTINKLKMFIQERMQVIGWSVWVLNIPLIATYIARISANRTLLQLISGIAGFAGLLQLGAYLYNQVLHQKQTINLSFDGYAYLNQPVFQFILGIGLFAFLFLVFYKKRTTWIMSNGFMKELPRKNEEGVDIYKVSEVSLYDGTKIKGLGMLARKWMLMCIGLLLIHTLGGWQVIQVELGLCAFIMCCLYFFALVGFWIECSKA